MSVAEKLTAIADAIREQTGDTAKLSLDDMPVAIRSLDNQIVVTATGETIVLTDSAYANLKGLTVYGKTTQNGTPTPEAPMEMVSAGDDGSVDVSVVGKNLIDYKTAIPRNDTQTVTVDESINGVHWYGDYFFYIPVNIPKGVNVRFSCKSSGEDTIDSFNVGYEDGTTDYNVLKYPILTQKNVIRIQVRKTNTGTRNNVTVWDMQLELGTTATDYEPYKAPQAITVPTPNGLAGIPVTSGGNYTDNNGQQWICDEVDFTRGVYVQRVVKIVLDGSDDERWFSEASTNAPYGVNLTYISNDIADCTGDDIRIMCDRYPPASINESWSAKDCLLSRLATNNPRICFRNTAISSLDAWKADVAANPITVQYILATPIETPLSTEQLEAYASLHTNYPNTTILNDDGAGMAVSYVAYTKNYIDNQVAAVSAAILNL